MTNILFLRVELVRSIRILRVGQKCDPDPTPLHPMVSVLLDALKPPERNKIACSSLFTIHIFYCFSQGS